MFNILLICRTALLALVNDMLFGCLIDKLLFVLWIYWNIFLSGCNFNMSYSWRRKGTEQFLNINKRFTAGRGNAAQYSVTSSHTSWNRTNKFTGNQSHPRLSVANNEKNDRYHFVKPKHRLPSGCPKLSQQFNVVSTEGGLTLSPTIRTRYKIRKHRAENEQKHVHKKGLVRNTRYKITRGNRTLNHGSTLPISKRYESLASRFIDRSIMPYR